MFERNPPLPVGKVGMTMASDTGKHKYRSDTDTMPGADANTVLVHLRVIRATLARHDEPRGIERAHRRDAGTPGPLRRPALAHRED
jgi:hypothetical protein